jgi:hypothetical protein
MYCLLELLTVVGLVVVIAVTLFAASATLIVIDEGLRWVFGQSPKSIGHVPSFSPALPKGWKVTLSGQLVSPGPKAGKL